MIDRPNQVWAMDITYVPIQGGFIYLCAVIDWYSRAVLAWALSNRIVSIRANNRRHTSGGNAYKPNSTVRNTPADRATARPCTG